MIVKNYTKDTRSLANYRPISLTNVSYKIFASLVQSRLATSLDSRIRPTQFGFRKNCSTSQPIHILRRLLEMHERQPSPFRALFLDWSKAFDSITFTASCSAMSFMGVSPHVISVIMSLYNNPSFRVRDSQQTFEIRTQTKVLRQGCPLSPYLFSMVLSHLFHDVENQYTSLFGLIPGVIHTPSPLWDLVYADDTVLLSNSAQHAKCDHLRLNSDQRICYSANTSFSACPCDSCTGNSPMGSLVPLSNEVKYSGVDLDTFGNSRNNTSYRISQAMHSSKLLKPLLPHSSLPPSWKLTVYRSIVLSILMYAMDSVLLSTAQITRLNAVHFKSYVGFSKSSLPITIGSLTLLTLNALMSILLASPILLKQLSLLLSFIRSSASNYLVTCFDILILLKANPRLCHLVPIASSQAPIELDAHVFTGRNLVWPKRPTG